MSRVPDKARAHDPAKPIGTSGTNTKLRRLRRPVSLEGRLLANRYHVTELIGTGGMGSVYAALDVATGRELALKALNPTAFTSTNLRRFRREADASVAIRHKHLCRVEYLGVDQGRPFIVMERLHGETLRTRLRETGPPSVGDAVSIALQLLDGLAVAHEAGLMHRDVKPGNVFVTSDRGKRPFIKLIDFGLAKVVPPRGFHDDDGSNEITGMDAIPGTPFYMTPEQLCGARDIDQRVDVWAVGLTFFEMLVGHRLYDSESYESLAAAILFQPAPVISQLRADVPPAFDTIFARALAKDRDERYRTAAEFRDALVDVWSKERVLALTRGEVLLYPNRPLQRGEGAPQGGVREPLQSPASPAFAKPTVGTTTVANTTHRPEASRDPIDHVEATTTALESERSPLHASTETRDAAEIATAAPTGSLAPTQTRTEPTETRTAPSASRLVGAESLDGTATLARPSPFRGRADSLAEMTEFDIPVDVEL